MASSATQSDEKGLGYEIFIALVSVLSIFNLFLVLVPGVDPDAVNVVNIINLFLTIIFIGDFGYRIITADSRTYYFFRDFGWADLLACFPLLRFLRLFRIFKAYRLVNTHGFARIRDYLMYNRAESAIYILIFAVIIILEGGSVLVLSAESKSPDANIRTAIDAMWWAYVTITTVGYGDRYPVTSAGRLVGMLVMTTGVGIFATFAGFIANKLLAPSKQEEDKEAREQKEQADLGKELVRRVGDLQSSLERQERLNADMAAKLERIEQALAQGTPPSRDQQERL